MGAEPTKWVTRKIGEFAARSKIINEDGTQLPPLSITKDRGVVLQSEKYKKQIATDLRKYVIARRDQFAFDPMSLYYGAIGRVARMDVGLVSPDYVVFDVDDTVDKTFLNYLLRSPPQVATYEAVAETGNSFGKRRRVYWSVLEQLAVRLPPLAEQRKIAAILAAVDEAIEATQAVIDQLQVVKKAMMAELLTRGLPGRHTRFKQTEIGEIPGEWSVMRLDAIVAQGPSNGRSPPSRTSPPGVPTFSIAAVRDGWVNIRDHLKYTDLEPAEASRFAVAPGDILIVRGNANPDLVGKCGRVDDAPDGCIYPDILMRVRLRPVILPSLFVTIWNSDVVHSQILDRATTTNGTYKINGEIVRSIALPIPTVEEQRLLAGTFDVLDSAHRANSDKLAALNSTKSALMSVLLTGELRIRPNEDATA